MQIGATSIGLDEMRLILNAAFLLLSLILATIILRSGVRFTLNIGDLLAQAKYKWRILKALLGLIVIGLAAAIFNLFFLVQ